MKTTFSILALSGLMLGAASPALADANAGLAELKANNLIVLGNLDSSSEVEGRTFVGGDLSGSSSNYFILNGKTAPASTAPGLTVVGDVTGGTKNLNNSSGAAIGGNESSGLNLNGPNQSLTIGGTGHDINGSSGSTITVGGAVSGNLNANGATVLTNQGLAGYQAGLAAQASAYATDLGDLSTYLAGLAATDAVTYPFPNRIQFKPLASASTLAVFDLSSTAVLNPVGEIDFQTGAFDTIIVNVGGTTATLGKNFIGSPGGLGQKVIWNFYEATTINFGANSFYGSVLAPKADGTIGNFIEGSAAFHNLVQRGEVHLNGYTGHLDITPPGGGGIVPEPATWALMIAGFGLAGAVLRRRRFAVA